MRILGVDPGTGKVGYGIIESEANRLNLVDYGCLTTPVGMPLSERLVIIFNEIKTLIEKFEPEQAAIEKLFFARNVTTVMSVGEARGVITLACALEKIEVAEYTPLQIKQALTGYGRAEKGQIQRMVQSVLGMEKPPRPDDAADALAVAITCSSSIRLGLLA